MLTTELESLPAIWLDDVRDADITNLHLNRALVVVDVSTILAPNRPPLFPPPLFEFRVIPDRPLPDIPGKRQIGALRDRRDGASFERLLEFYVHRTKFRLRGELSLTPSRRARVWDL